jgi:hypothetical protein
MVRLNAASSDVEIESHRWTLATSRHPKPIQRTGVEQSKIPTPLVVSSLKLYLITNLEFTETSQECIMQII